MLRAGKFHPVRLVGLDLSQPILKSLSATTPTILGSLFSRRPDRRASERGWKLSQSTPLQGAAAAVTGGAVFAVHTTGLFWSIPSYCLQQIYVAILLAEPLPKPIQLYCHVVCFAIDTRAVRETRQTSYRAFTGHGFI